ncbi:MAG: hypothetical protein Q7S22_06035 [Candidatus Micrarchaeota archaeon]|nr:hypothetical protein [Candidatus Micrarchaeota archaeon]
MENEKQLIIGIGDAGNNSIVRLRKIRLDGFGFLAINHDAKFMTGMGRVKKLLVKKADTFSKTEILYLKKEFDRVAKVVILVGLGGRTGSALTPKAIRIVHKCGINVLAILTYPFPLEKSRVPKADLAISKIKKTGCEVILRKNGDLVGKYPDVPMTTAFRLMDEELGAVLRSRV